MYGPFGLLNQPVNPWFDPQKMDPNRVPLGLLSQQPDAPAPMAVEAGPMPQQPQQPMQLPSANGGPAAQPAQPQGGLLSGIDGFLNKLGNVYGAGGPGDGLINLGLAVASPGNMSQNILNASAANNRTRLVNAQLGNQQNKQAGLNETAKLFAEKFGWSPDRALAVANSPAANEFIKQIAQSPEQYETLTQGNDVFQKNTRTGQMTLLKKGEDQWRPLTDPEERARYGIKPTDTTPYKIDSRGNFQAVGNPTTNINTGPGPSKNVFEAMEKMQGEASAAAGSLPAFQEAKRLIDTGNITLGAGADVRVGMQKIGALFGMDATSASNAETFRATIAPTVLAMVKGLGAGSGISNADREFAEKAAGGNINLEPATIKRLLDIGEKAARYKVESYGKRLDSVYPENDENRQVRSLFQVNVPPYSPPEATAPPPAQGQPRRVNSEAEYKMLRSGETFVAPDGSIRRKP